MRYTLIDGQGNFGSVDGDAAAAYRYTECRLERITGEMLADIDRETVDFVPNYDGKEREPVCLPTKVPNLLVNGSSGIAVGMATNIPPHNLGEVVDACLALLADPAIEIEALIRLMPAPDFPTKGLIYGLSGVHEGYRTGRGRVVMRARTHFEEIDKGARSAIIVDELPYQVNKKTLLERIAELIKEGRLEGISHIADESDKRGIRVVFELKRGEMPEVVLNNLFKLTQLQDTFGINMVALVDGRPRLLNVKQMLEAFLAHRREVVIRRTIYELRKARERAHLQEGLAVALSNVDEIIALIKAARTPAEAKAGLMGRAWQSALVAEMLSRSSADFSKPEDLGPEFGLTDAGYRLSDAQAQRILELQLQRLTGLEQDKIVADYKELLERIGDYLDLLAQPARITGVIAEELKKLKADYGDKRQSEVVLDTEEIGIEDLITPEDMVVTFSHSGYIKAQPVADYRAQRRGGRGKQAAATKQDDFIERLFVANTHDHVLCFSSRGKVYWLKVYEVPQGTRTSRGRPIVNLFPLEEGEKINAVLPVKHFDGEHFVFFATANGTVKKTPLTDFSRPLKKGIIAIDLEPGDYLIGAAITDGSHHIMLFSDAGKAVRFEEADVRPMGRAARGVIGMRLPEGVRVVSMLTAADERRTVLTATENGYGKRTPIGEYTLHGRGTQGMIAIQTNERNGRVVGAVLVEDRDEIMLVSSGGVLVRIKVDQIREMGRSTQGVTLINLDAGDRLACIEKVLEAEEENGGDGTEGPASGPAEAPGEEGPE
jgi:DNA gyrase subunit A